MVRLDKCTGNPYLAVMQSNIVHQYFKKEWEGSLILVQVDPVHYTGLELIVHPSGEIEKTSREFDEEIFDDLEADEFVPASPLEFNLYLKGLAK
jgi:hypothetical protein